MLALHRRILIGAATVISVIVVATLLRIGFEWSQALADIDAMIVTPVALPTEVVSPTAQPITSSEEIYGPPPPPSTQPTTLPTTQIDPPSATATAEALKLSRPELNILLLGTDARPDDTGPTRTDAIVLVHIARDTGRVSMLSIPRDLWVSYPTGGEGRINAAYAIGEHRFGPGGGAALAKSTVSKLLGIPVDYFILINFDGFKKIIDIIGGIEIDVPRPIYDPAYPTEDYGTIEVSFDTGRQWMDSERALIYARTRHADSDFGRNQRQQQVLMAIFQRIRERGLLQQVTSIDDYTGALRGYVLTDLNRRTMLELANFARTVREENILRYAIDSSSIVELGGGATFRVQPQALKRIVAQFTGEAVSTAGGE
ncbi:LCP family protein [Chloroflexus aggregans]|uniref:Cell envelope-related transcriptional attenuator n=1 Tax=Chloroflexus aggregans (strain MD-66 / DSM 9485) TaxID=326427 RepID=B8G830_CHLAD|nr:LCP family protein [Chloroflexus aggregans]ACL26084.1 cell envelope-related transcriptional attenuator [Chloroflexus aggregans DSM 9485]